MFDHDHDRPLVFGHRGASAKPENTLDAFDHARTCGADGVELDVRFTSEREIVVIHDANLERTTGLAGAVHETTLVHIRTSATTHVPTLAEVLEWARAGGELLNIEVKNLPGYDSGGTPSHDLILAVAAAVAARGLTSRTVISSFNVHDLLALKAAFPDFRVAWLTMPMVPHHELVAVADAHGIDGIHPHISGLGGEALDRAVRDVAEAVRCRWLMPWTVNSPDEVRRAAAAGVGGIVTDEPALVLDALEHLG
ncbi:MAG: hypothetical protein IT198_05075 [Acidimicrobiia bacterium]|nr:hypothetical protein [Acidimicrobiia bacterium]